MKRRVPCTFPLSSCLAVVAAVALAACGSPSAREGVTGAPDPQSVLPALDQGTVSESGETKVPVCHKGVDKMVPPDAVADHEGHGDHVGSCSSGGCPCFRVTDITTFGQTCIENSATLSAQCTMSSPDEPAFLLLNCAAGSGPDRPSTYASTGGGGVCAWEQSGDGLLEIAADQHAACVAAMLASGYCS